MQLYSVRARFFAAQGVFALQTRVNCFSLEAAKAGLSQESTRKFKRRGFPVYSKLVVLYGFFSCVKLTILFVGSTLFCGLVMGSTLFCCLEALCATNSAVCQLRRYYYFNIISRQRSASVGSIYVAGQRSAFVLWIQWKPTLSCILTTLVHIMCPCRHLEHLHAFFALSQARLPA